MRLIFTIFFLCFLFSLYSQSRITLSNNIILNIQNGGIITINNANDNALTQTTGGGKIISEGENNAMQWIINNSIGSYTVPFATSSLVPIPLILNVTNAGVTPSVASVYFSTYETSNDDNTNYPSDVTNMNSNCSNNNGLFAVDRFWRIDAQGYTNKPTPVISFGYNNAINEIAITNTITEAKLKAQRFNNNINSWETPQKLYGIANMGLQQVANVNVLPTDFYKTWALIDSNSLTIPITVVNTATNGLCAGNSAIIELGGASNYTLLPNFISTSTTSFVVTPNTTTTYTIVGSIGTGTALCLSDANNSSSIFTIAVNSLPTTTTNITDILCYGDNTGSITAILTSTSAVTYTWSNGSHATTINGLAAGTYTLFVKDVNNCTASYTAAVLQPANVLSLNVISQNPLCYNDANGFVTAIAQGGTANYTYTWQPSGANTATISNLTAGNYTIYAMDDNACKTQSVVSLSQALSTLVTSISSSLQPNCSEANGNIYSKTVGGVAPYQYQWLQTNTINGYIDFISEGTYTLLVTDSYGCVDTLVANLTCLLPISFPNFFSPNADGKNDAFEIKGIERYPNNKVTIYNRWGNLIYSKTNYQNDWNGSSNVSNSTGKERLPSSTYFIVVDLGEETNQKPYTGYVELRY